MNLKKYIPNKIKLYISKKIDFYSYNIHTKKNTQKLIEHINQKKQAESSNTIRIGFLVQSPVAWDKLRPVYEKISSSKQFTAILIQIPHFDVKSWKLTKNYLPYYSDLYSDHNILKAFDKQHNIISIKTMDLDYLFYERPYNVYIPKELNSLKVSEFTKICYLPYGITGADTFTNTVNPYTFMNNLYFMFCPTEENKYTTKKYLKSINRKIKCKFFDTGYPDLAKYYLNSSNVKNSCNQHKVMWTPRFLYDDKIGGSHFFEYKDLITSKRFVNNWSLIFRPHPMMFDTFIRQGYLKEKEVKEYISKVKNLGGIYDLSENPYDSICEADLLITDYSSLIVTYFITGKPIIYCPSNFKLNKTFSMIEDCLYIANNEKELKLHMRNLQNGNDYLQNQRLELIKKHFSKHSNAINNIINIIIDDYNKTYKTDIELEE